MTIIRTRILLALAFVAAASAAGAEPALSRIDVITSPLLATAAAGSFATTRAVSGGQPVQLIVTAVYTDGSTQDVSARTATQYTATPAQVVTVSASGSLQFAAVGTQAAAAVVVEYGGERKILTFDVRP